MLRLFVTLGVMLSVLQVTALAQGRLHESRMKIFSSSGVISTDKNDIEFHLWPDPSNTSLAEAILYKDDASLLSTSYDPSKPTKFLIHGYKRNAFDQGKFPQNVKDAYLSRATDHSYNIITVNWANLSTPATSKMMQAFYYANAAENVKRVGERLGEFIVWLRNSSKIDLDSTHLVGYSLGAHVAGYAGETVARLTDGLHVSRITGLDPAGPLFYTSVSSNRGLGASDAKFVDGYHSAAGVFGTTKRVGTVDFYINGGYGPQPGCGMDIIRCSHRFAHKSFAKTILKEDPKRNPDSVLHCVCKSVLKYTLNKKCCDKKVSFGEYIDPATSGKFYINYKLP